MKNYTVYIPISGYISMDVDANSEEEAIDIVFEKATLDNVEEWDMHKSIVEGNVFHGLSNSIDIIENK